MATTTIPWGDGSGDNIYLTYSSASGDQTVEVSSDANTGSARSKVVTFASEVGGITQQLTVNQEAGVKSYVTDGLVLWLDGIDKGPDNTAWVDKVSGYSFANNGATFNNNHVSFDGNDYLSTTSYSAISSSTGTIEVCFEDGAGSSKTSRILFFPKNEAALAFGIVVSGNTKKIIWSYNSSRSMYIPVPTKGTVSVSTARAISNGSTMTASGSDYWSGTKGTTYIGRRPSGNYFTGKIYSIRIYNRKLTESEVLNNYAVDNERFELGL